MKITFSRQELAAALLFTSNDDSRMVLNSLCLTYRPGESPIAVSTDGRRLCVINAAFPQEPEAVEGAESFELVLASDFVKPVCAIAKALGGKLFPLITIEHKPGSKRVVVSLMGGKTFLECEEGAIVEGKYPNWKAVVPSKRAVRAPVSELALNSDFVGDYGKLVKIFDAPSPVVNMNLVGKDSQIEIRLPSVPNFYGLVMPCKIEQEGEDYQPEFLGIVKDLPKDEPEEQTSEQGE